MSILKEINCMVKSALSSEDRLINDASTAMRAIDIIRDNGGHFVARGRLRGIPGFPRFRFDSRSGGDFVKRERWGRRLENRLGEFFSSGDPRAKSKARAVARKICNEHDKKHREKEMTDWEKYVFDNFEPEFVFQELYNRGIDSPTLDDVKTVIEDLRAKA